MNSVHVVACLPFFSVVGDVVVIGGITCLVVEVTEIEDS
jgi:hypothetical protein